MDNDVHAFVIRIWNEGIGAGKAKVWRGYIEHVNHDSRMYFSDLSGIARFISRQIQIQSKEPATGWRAWLPWIIHAIAAAPKKLHF